MRAPWRETLNVQWTDERPTEPGEYWLSLHPDKRQCHAPVLKVILEHNRTDSLHVRVVGDDAGWLGLSCGGWLDGAKWSRRETPADPFEVTK
jgi:hypothetical protein